MEPKDKIEMVKKHLIETKGEPKAIEFMRKLSVLEILIIADTLHKEMINKGLKSGGFF